MRQACPALRRRVPLADLLSYDVAAREWRHVRAKPAPGPPRGGGGGGRAAQSPRVPPPRWKAGTAQLDAGLVVFGGDAYPPK